ncbi:MAG: hypothetical protein AAF950_18010 [Pseudomonadota bacterium]
MKRKALVIAAAAFSLFSFVGKSHALDCSTIGGKMEHIARAYDHVGIVRELHKTKSTIATIIKICDASVDFDDFVIKTGEHTLKYDTESTQNCDASTVGGKSEELVRNVQSKNSDVFRQINAVNSKTDELLKVFLSCVGKKDIS